MFSLHKLVSRNICPNCKQRYKLGFYGIEDCTYICDNCSKKYYFTKDKCREL